MNGAPKFEQTLSSGTPMAEATHALLCLHGRGGSAQDILGAAAWLRPPDGFHLFAPQAIGATWYPLPFTASRAANEPFLGTALRRIDALIDTCADAGILESNIVLLGFSQGACLAAEFMAFTPRRLGGLIAWSGGVIGERVEPERYLSPERAGRLKGVPVFLGCSDVDPHIPKARVDETAGIFSELGARVDCRIYPGMGHLVNEEEIQAGSELLRGIRTRTAPSTATSRSAKWT
jgi:predicted esterase